MSTDPRQWWASAGWRARCGVLLVAWLTAGLYVVGPDQIAVVRVAGRASPPVGSGVWWRPPWPVSQVDRVQGRRARQVTIGASGGEGLVGRGASSREEHLTGDQNLLLMRATVQYTIADPRQFLFAAARVDDLVAAVVQAQLTAATASSAVDDLMTTGRESVRADVLREAQRSLDEYGLGVRLDVLSLEQVQPPAAVAAAFNDVNSAKQDRDRQVNEARGYANEVVPRAEGQAFELRSQASAYQTRVVDEATGRADRFRRLAAEYAQARQVTRIRLHLETAEKVAAGMNLTVVEGTGGSRPIDLGVIGLPPAESQP